VLVNRFDRSMFLANSRALALAGITDRTPDPPGGEIRRDAAGRATGVLTGTAVDLVRKVIPRQTLDGEPRGGWFPDQRLTIEEAIEAATTAPAWASFEEGIKGTLTVGTLADVAVFDTDLVGVGRADPARLLKARATLTIAGGRVVYER
jgi:predicted amidohydrolase YtcJ